MELETSKNLGGIGAILLVIASLAFVGPVYLVGILGLIGWILVFIAMKGLSDYYNEGGIFNNYLYGFVVSIVGVIAFAATLVISFLLALSSFAFDWANPAGWEAFFANLTDFNALLPLLGSILAAIVVAFIFAVVAAIFHRKSLNLLAAKSGVNLFATAGLILLIGAVLTIIVVGVILIWIALIIIAWGFFSLKPKTAEPPPAPPPPPS